MDGVFTALSPPDSVADCHDPGNKGAAAARRSRGPAAVTRVEKLSTPGFAMTVCSTKDGQLDRNDC